MVSESQSSRSIRLRDYRYPGEVRSLLLTFIVLTSLYVLGAFVFPTSWGQSAKAVAITLLGLGVYVITVLVQQRGALGSLVRVGPRQFPELHERALMAAEYLSSPPVPVHVKRASEMNIYTLGFWRQPIIVVTSSLVDQMDLDNLQFFIGREIGHVRAGHTWLRTLLKPVGSEVPVIGRLLNSVIFGDWINRTEFTADRAGFIACRSLTTAVSTMLKFGVGIRLYEKLDIRQFLEQLDEVRNVRGRVMEIVSEMPYLTQRVRALVRFALSHQFQQIVPERRTYTQILSALPKNFLNSSQIRAVDDVERAKEQPVSSVQGRTSDLDELRTSEDPITLFDEIDDVESAERGFFQLVACDTNQSYVLRSSLTRIGRQKDNDIVIPHERVSRHHAEIEREGARIFIQDHSSRNGVWLNGWRISEKTELKSGDQIRIGRQEFTLQPRK
jgi:Zn-dependent protease with chaperone function